MIELFAGLAVGFALGLICARYTGHTDANDGTKNAPSGNTGSLNGKENDQAEKELQERLEKQFKNLMAYTGKKQA